ncbi:MAG: DUF2950 domain-containing protein [Nitrospiraceae bacterium]|nr:DUF2950 domain-containing protein [Nitrospiraceae bacterium]
MRVNKITGRLMRTALVVAAVIAVNGISGIPGISVVSAYVKPNPSGNQKQLTFKSPQKAFDALVNAAARNNTEELMAIFGPDGKDIVSSGDAVADTYARARFTKSAMQGVKFRKLNKKTVLAIVGKDGWTFPIPIVRTGKSWVFFTAEGRQEILNRRIGRNELNTIQASLSYVKAQREYAMATLNTNGRLQYAQFFISHRGSRDGLYWHGMGNSPLGAFFARAACNEDASGKGAAKPVPYYGYYFKILKGQGAHAPGGKMDYVVNGRMTGGFGLVAYPARYGVSGIMTLMVNQQGIVYEKDLGAKTDELAPKITRYNPGPGWKKVALPEAAASGK